MTERQAWFAVTIEYDHDALLASDVEQAIEEWLASDERTVKATVVFVSEDTHDRLRDQADPRLRPVTEPYSEQFLEIERLAKAAFALQKVRYLADRLLTAVDTSVQTCDLPATHTMKINAEELRAALYEEPQLYEVIAIDWAEPNVIATFEDEGAARRYAATMDSAALRCTVRDARTNDAV